MFKIERIDDNNKERLEGNLGFMLGIFFLF